MASNVRLLFALWNRMAADMNVLFWGRAGPTAWFMFIVIMILCRVSISREQMIFLLFFFHSNLNWNRNRNWISFDRMPRIESIVLEILLNKKTEQITRQENGTIVRNLKHSVIYSRFVSCRYSLHKMDRNKLQVCLENVPVVEKRKPPCPPPV